jgi:hypothetical protein
MMDFGGAKPRQNKKRRLLLAGAAILIVIFAVLTVFLFWHQSGRAEKDTDALSKSQRIINKISALYIVPQNEEPTLAQIKDLDKLKGQEFFAHAQNGDYLLIYTQAKMAFLYRDAVGRLVNAGPIKPGNNAATPTQIIGQ